MGFLMQQQGPVANQSSQVGIQLFAALAIFQLFLILFITPATVAASISGERQRQTWDLLLVTRLTPFGIVWGKLVTGLAFSVLLLFASLPLFSLVFLFGGVAPEDILHTYLVFLAMIVLLGSVSLLVSAATRRVAVSMIVANVVALTLGVGISLLAVYLQSTEQTPYYGGPGGPPPQPPLTPLAEVDPLIALLSTLPQGSGSSMLSTRLGTVRHALMLPWTMPMWETFVILAAVLTALCLAVSTLLIRYAPGALSREGE
jgi:ABC-type transport system involved in multi-copper enzyme maturation permease subunit